MSNYNGWTNYATWNTALWVDNEEYTYFTRIDEQKRIVEWTAALVESFVREVFPDGTPDMQDGVMMRDGLNAVNYEEIATHWNEE
jgi:hypothetical protein